MVRNFRMIFAAVLAAAGGAALASPQPCADVLTSYASCSGTTCAEIVSQHAECFAGGSATSNTQINATVFNQASAISRAIASRSGQAGPGPVASAESGSGLAAGGSQAWNLWASHGRNVSRISYTNTAGTNTRTDNNIDNTVLGGDYALSPKMALGLSLAIDRSNGAGSLAGGPPNITGTSGYTLAPYLGYQIDKVWALDASAGWGKGRYTAGAVKAEANRWFATGNLSYNRWVGNWQYTGKFGYLHGNESYGDTRNNGAVVARTATRNSVDQARVGVQASYWMNGFMPYAGMGYALDFNRSTNNGAGVDPIGRRAWVYSLGVNFFSLSSKITGGIAYEQEGGRTSSRSETLTANLNFRF